MIITEDRVRRVEHPDTYEKCVMNKIKIDKEWARKLFIERLRIEYVGYVIPDDAELTVTCAEKAHIQWPSVKEALTEDQYKELRKIQLASSKKKAPRSYIDEDEE